MRYDAAIEALRKAEEWEAIGVLEKLREAERKRRKKSPARRTSSQPFTREKARSALYMHVHTPLNQQEIASRLGVNQARVNEVIKGVRFPELSEWRA